MSRAIAFINRSRPISKYPASFSMPMNWRPSITAATPVVPEAETAVQHSVAFIRVGADEVARQVERLLAVMNGSALRLEPENGSRNSSCGSDGDRNPSRA